MCYRSQRRKAFEEEGTIKIIQEQRERNFQGK